MLLLLVAVDLLACLSLVLVVFGAPLVHLQAGAAFLLLLKGIFFFYDVLSVIDLLVAAAMFALIWVDAPKVAVGLAVYLGIKGLYSLA